MKIVLDRLEIDFRKSKEIVSFSQVTYFYGQMGAGKSSIARLVDFCLGGTLELSPAFQNEFNGVTLTLAVEETKLLLERQRDSDQIIASWDRKEEYYSVVIPARSSNGAVLPDTDVEVVSDLIFYLAGMKSPKVRQNKRRTNTKMKRLSLRNLLWFSYLDQQTIDSTFFHLDPDSNPFKRNASRDTLRFVVGYHRERVAELEEELQDVRSEKRELHRAANSLREALDESGVASQEDIDRQIQEARSEIEKTKGEIREVRQQTHKEFPLEHGTEILRSKARDLSYELESIEEAIPKVKKQIEQDERYKNEIKMYGVKLKRDISARAVIGGVSFEKCPRCAQSLPERQDGDCILCGQPEPVEGSDNVDNALLARDADDRIDDLEEAISRHQRQLRKMRRRREEIANEKAKVDNKINDERERYDSAYLSRAITLEQQRASIEERIIYWNRLRKLPERVNALRSEADELEPQILELSRNLEEAREKAEKDGKSIHRLEELFLDCLIRAQLPGIESTDKVHIDPSKFYPEITKPTKDDTSLTTFLALESGGKMTMFKSCFALAIHRLAREEGAALPTFLIIDSPTKNISERQNEIQFEGFHRLVYELAAGELQDTQFIIIDKEYATPPEGLDLDMDSRLMNPNDLENPPLIPYYSGH